jgi:acyl carrier protein
MEPGFVDLLRPFLKYAGDQQITERSCLRDLGLDSMREIEVLFAIEDAYRVTIPDDRLTDATFETTGSLWSVIDDLRPAGERS